MTTEKRTTAEQRPGIIPYLVAAELLWKRLRWDLRAEAWRSRRALREWKDRFRGGKAVILCNGPSLLKTDFSTLDSVFTFGLNKINLLFDKTPFRPSAVVAVNPFVIEQNLEFYKSTEIPLFIDSGGYAALGSRPNLCYVHSTGVHRFARDCSWSVFQGHTVTYVALQLAFHCGFEKVAVIGCDHNFSAEGPANAVAVAGDRDNDHFDPNYFSGGVPWQLPDLVESEIAYMRAARAYRDASRLLVNATEGGRLEVFPRMPLDEFLELPG